MSNYLFTTKDINEYLCEKDSVFIDIIDKCKSVRIKLDEDYFESLIYSIAGQKLSRKVALTIYGRLQELCNKRVTPEIILKFANEKIREVGLSYSKINYIKNLAGDVINNKVDFSRIEDMDNADVIKILTGVKGIGRWTAEMFLIFALGREDVFSKGDGGLQRAICTTYKIDTKIIKSRVEQISNEWKPYRTYASLYLWDLINKTFILKNVTINDIKKLLLTQRAINDIIFCVEVVLLD